MSDVNEPANVQLRRVREIVTTEVMAFTAGSQREARGLHVASETGTNQGDSA